MLSERGATPIESFAMVWFIRCLKRIEKMRVGRWPNVIFNEGMSERKKTWMKQNYIWMHKWNIYLNACPTSSKVLKDFIMEKFRKRVWGKELGRKKKYYIEEFNPKCDLQQKEFTGASVPWRAKGGQRFLLLN